MKIGIRPYSIEDIQELYSVVADSFDHLSPWMPWCHANYQINDTKSWVEDCIHAWEAETAFRYLIYDDLTARLLGAVGLERVDTSHKIAELGYWVSSAALDRGVATSATTLAVNAGFGVHGLKRIEIYVLPGNKASNKVAKNIGAIYEGKLRNRLFHHDKSRPANAYSLIPSDIT